MRVGDFVNVKDCPGRLGRIYFIDDNKRYCKVRFGINTSDINFPLSSYNLALISDLEKMLWILENE